MHEAYIICMSKHKGSELRNHNKLSKSQKWSSEDRKAFTDLFALLLEMHNEQQNDLMKEHSHADKQD